ncbi:MAG: DUF1989 domain-containing protein [Pseudomonadales bacterium]|nr:DUF1989 domain-containing protein [Pseudomonadales bacterium]
MIKTSPLNCDTADQHHLVDAGDYFIGEISAGSRFRIVDLHGNQAVDTLFYSAQDKRERYSMMDTIRAQGNVYLSAGSVLMSNDNQAMLSIVADTCGRHDTLGGACATESNTVRYALEKKCMHACRDSWLLALAQHEQLGMNKRDIAHNINFFMNVPVTAEGGLRFADGISDAGKYVELEAHMDILVLISNCPQLNNPCNAYNPTPIALYSWQQESWRSAC